MAACRQFPLVALYATTFESACGGSTPPGAIEKEAANAGFFFVNGEHRSCGRVRGDLAARLTAALLSRAVRDSNRPLKRVDVVAGWTPARPRGREGTGRPWPPGATLMRSTGRTLCHQANGHKRRSCARTAANRPQITGMLASVSKRERAPLPARLCGFRRSIPSILFRPYTQVAAGSSPAPPIRSRLDRTAGARLVMARDDGVDRAPWRTVLAAGVPSGIKGASRTAPGS